MADPVCSATCSLEGIASTPLDLPQAIADLAARGVSPDTFHFEERDARLASLGACSPAQISLFGNLQTSLTSHIGDMSTQQIAENLQRLRNRAYRYDPATRTMDVANPQAKQELDLWIAVIDSRAFQDQNFLNRILERHSPSDQNICLPGGPVETPRSEASREIEIVMNLNSSNLSAHDRGTFYRLRNNLATWAEVGREDDGRILGWMKQDNGRTMYIDTPYWRSVFEFEAAATAWLGRDRLQQIAHDNFSESMVRGFAAQLGMGREFESLRALSDDALLLRLQGLSGMSFSHPSPQVMQRLNREFILGNYLLTGRDGSYDSRIRENLIRDLMNFRGFSRADAELYVGPEGTSAPNYTASRLDNYQRRFELLGKYRDLYREFLTTPLADRFTPERMDRFNLWGQQILSGGRVSGAPITLEDIDRIRLEVQQEVGVQTSGQMTWDQFISRDVRQPLFVRPDELGGMSLASDSCSEPFAVSSRMMVNGRPLNEIIRENVEFIAILPPELFPTDHAAGQAFYLFGITILNGDNWRSDLGNIPSAGTFHETLAHEVAGHEVWARSQFNDYPERLTWLGVSERYAYTTGRMAAIAYGETNCAQPEELPFLNYLEATGAARVRAANRRLGLDPDDLSPRLMADHWVGKSEDYFQFQPGFMVGPNAEEVPAPADEVRALSPEIQRRYFSLIVDGTAEDLRLSSEDRGRLREAVSSLERLGPNDVSATFTSGHPLLRVINRIYGRFGTKPMDHMTLTAEQWKQVAVNVIATNWVANQRDRQLAIQVSQDESDWRRLEPLRGDFWSRAEAGLSADDSLLLQDGLSQISQMEQVSRADPLVFDASHPLVHIVNHALESRHQRPFREIRVQDLSQWRQIELYLLRGFAPAPASYVPRPRPHVRHSRH